MIEDLIKRGNLLELGGFAYHLHLCVDPALIAVPGDTPIPEISDLLICPQCWVVNSEPSHPIWTRPDARPPRMGAG